MAKKPTKTPRTKAPKLELAPGGLQVHAELVGEKKNYNLQPGVTEYRLWPFSTIEWVASFRRFKARAILQQARTRNLVAINSWHEDYGDAERAIDLLSDSLSGVGERHVYNVFAVTLEEHTADIGGGPPVRVSEVLGLIWSMQQVAAA